MSIYKIMQFVQIFTFTTKLFTFHEFHKKFYSSLSPSDKLRCLKPSPWGEGGKALP